MTNIKDIHKQAEMLYSIAVSAPNLSFSEREKYFKNSRSKFEMLIEKYNDEYDNMSAVYTTYTTVLMHLYMGDYANRNTNKYKSSMKDFVMIDEKQYNNLLKYNQLALEARSTNKVAPKQKVSIHLMYNKFDEAIKCLEGIDLTDIEKFLIYPYSHADALSSLIFEEAAEGIINKGRIKFLEALVSINYTSPLLPPLLNAYRCMNLKEDIYSALEFCESMVSKCPDSLVLFGDTIGYLAGAVNEADKIIKYIEPFIDYLKDEGLAKDKKFSSTLNSSLDVLATAYMIKGDFEKSYGIRKSINKKFVNNTTLHNMGLLLYKMKRYDEAVNFLRRALFIYEDESSYIILGDSYFASKNYLKALEAYKKALAFTKANDVRFMSKDNKLDIISTKVGSDYEDVNKKLYENIVYCYIQLKDYDKAVAYNDMAKELYIHESNFMKNDLMLEALIQQGENIKNKELVIKEITMELEKEKELIRRKSGQIREWAIVLTGIQEDLNEDDDWEVFESKMLELADSICEKMNSDKGMKKALKDIRKKYYTLESKSMNFLSTAEMLYMTYNDELIDFAPIIIEYCKVIEVEINTIFRKVYNSFKNHTLGEIKYMLKNEGNKYLVDKLEKIVSIRNKSAHSGDCSKEDMELIRTTILDELIGILLQMKKKGSLEI